MKRDSQQNHILLLFRRFSHFSPNAFQHLGVWFNGWIDNTVVMDSCAYENMSHLNERPFSNYAGFRSLKGHPVCVGKGHTVLLQCFQTLLSCQTWYGYIGNCRSIGLFWPGLGDGNTPRAVFDTSVNLISIKQDREKAALTQHEIYNSVPQPAVLS